MGWDCYEESTPIARKDYNCDASDFLCEMIGEVKFSFAELRLIVKAKRDKWRIKKGQKYLKVKGKWDGDFCTFRARPELDDICRKHELYYE